jgi:MOSC domain-containing protein YiiM
MPQLVSLQIGLPQNYPGDQSRNILTRAWTTGFFKAPVTKPVELTPTGLKGDGVADTKVHGGLDKALLVYSTDHYPAWLADIGLELSPGSFGENLSITGMNEQNVCIGDRWQLGDVILEVSQPRQPCWKLARRHLLPNLPKLVINSNRSGWYMRIIQTGLLSAPFEIVRLSNPYPEWTIANVNNAYYQKPKNQTHLQALANLSELATSWREDFLGMLE